MTAEQTKKYHYCSCTKADLICVGNEIDININFFLQVAFPSKFVCVNIRNLDFIEICKLNNEINIDLQTFFWVEFPAADTK